MQNIALDTNAYTGLGRGSVEIKNLLTNTLSIGIPSMVMGEIYFGIYSGNNSQKNSLLFEKFMNNDRVKVLNVNEATTRLFGEISAQLRSIGKPIQQNDIWIAALCKQYNYYLVTNDAGFNNIIGLNVINFN
ncbi:MAG: PIN domain-containing protein [bacterium]|jgi:tRNA(fMet)-specific endonuclease VapC